MASLEIIETEYTIKYAYIKTSLEFTRVSDTFEKHKEELELLKAYPETYEITETYKITKTKEMLFRA